MTSATSWTTRHRGVVVYVFTPESGRFPAGIWSTTAEAEAWIVAHDARGTLSKYELGASAYDAARTHGRFAPKRPVQGVGRVHHPVHQPAGPLAPRRGDPAAD